MSSQWSAIWDDIANGGAPRWKAVDAKGIHIALQHLTERLPSQTARILCPLAGDDPFVHHAWSSGHAVTTIDLVPAAVARMRDQFGTDWTREDRADGTVVWVHGSGRATLYQGDMFNILPELRGSFDAVYDKDSFGALEKHMRANLCSVVADYTKSGAVVYIEVKEKADDHPQRDAGPPFSVRKEDLMEHSSFGEMFEYVAGLGEVYSVGMPKATQMGHVLKRK